jgi:hypothetical protein
MSPRSDQTSKSPVDVANLYLDAFYTGDHARARAFLCDLFRFSGPLVQVTGADAFLQSAEGLRQIVRGHVLHRQWVDGGDVCSIYDVLLETPLGRGSITMSEWNRVEQGLLQEARVLFDTVPFRALLPPSPHG